jgi:hypothetical protein
MTEESVHDYCSEALASAAAAKSNGGAPVQHDDQPADRELDQHAADAEQNKTVRPVMDEAAYFGVGGDVVRTIAPHTEADPVAGAPARTTS